MRALTRRLVRDRRAQDLIEYSLLAACIALAVFAALSAIGGPLNTMYSNIAATATAVAGS